MRKKALLSLLLIPSISVAGVGVALLSAAVSAAISSTAPIIKKHWFEASEQQKKQQVTDQTIKLNNIAIERAELKLKAEKDKVQEQDFMRQLALKKEELALQKEKARVQVVASLASLLEKKAKGEAFTDEENQNYEVCKNALQALALKADTQKAASAA